MPFTDTDIESHWSNPMEYIDDYRWINVARFCSSFCSTFFQEPTVHALHVVWEALKGMATLPNGRRRFITVCFFFWFYCWCFCFPLFLDNPSLLSSLRLQNLADSCRLNPFMILVWIPCFQSFSCGWDDYRRQMYMICTAWIGPPSCKCLLLAVRLAIRPHGSR